MTDDPDPILLEVYRHRLASIAEEMGETLRRSAFSPNIKERRDYSCAIFDGEGSLVAQATHIPVHLGSMPLAVRAVIEDFSGDLALEPGDAVLLNDPYRGGTHLPDLTLVTPVFGGPSPEPSRPRARLSAGPGPPPGERESRDLAWFVASRAHHADVGGATPGSLPPEAAEVFEEGIRIPPVRLIRRGAVDRDVLRLILANVRTPSEREGDLRAQIAANLRGAERLLGLEAEAAPSPRPSRPRARLRARQPAPPAAARLSAGPGPPPGEREELSEPRRYARYLQDYAETLMRRCLAAVPDATYEGEDALDDGTRIAVAVTKRGEAALVDFSVGTDPERRDAPLNANLAVTSAAVAYVFRAIAGGADVPANAGALRPIRIVAPAGTVVNASFPAAMSGGNVETSQRIVDALLRALARALPDRVPAASAGSMSNLAIGGLDPRRAPARRFSYYETIAGGAGASAAGPGASAIQTHMTNTWNTPIEVLEHAYPFRVTAQRIRRGSGGRGRHRGGDGLVREIELLAEARATLLSERRKLAPYGLAGGEPGGKGVNYVIRAADGRRETLPGRATVTLSPGDRIGVETPGGGGFGEPADPSAEMSGRSD